MAIQQNAYKLQSEPVKEGEEDRLFTVDPDSLWNENQRLQGDLQRSLAERNRLLKKLNDSSATGRPKAGSRVLGERLTDTRSRLSELERENSHLAEGLAVTQDRLEQVKRMPVSIVERIDEIISLLTGAEQTPRKVGLDTDQLNDQLNSSLESLWRVLESNGAFENASLRKDVASLASVLERKRDEVAASARDKQAAEKELATAEESINQLMSNNALRDSRLSALQNRVVDLEEENNRLTRSNLKFKGQIKDLRGAVDPDTFSQITRNSDMRGAEQESAFESSSGAHGLFTGLLGLAIGGLVGILFMWMFMAPRETSATMGPIRMGEGFTQRPAAALRDGKAPLSEKLEPSPLPLEPVRDKLMNAGLGPEMVPVDGGQFVMGTDRYSAPVNEKPARGVRVNPFFIARYEVSFDQYDAFARASGRPIPDDQGQGRGNRPVVNITWEDAEAYAQWLGTRTGQIYRLPTEREWEFAMAAGMQTPFWWGNEPKKGMEICLDCGTRWDGMGTGPVGSAEANPLGLFDMGGNAMEWVADCMEKATTPWSTDAGCASRTVRGGAFDKPMQATRTTARRGLSGKTGYPTVGFRLVREIRHGSGY